MGRYRLIKRKTARETKRERKTKKQARKKERTEADRERERRGGYIVRASNRGEWINITQEPEPSSVEGLAL